MNINLKDFTVLTEIGNNYYFYIPFIAALARAKKVYVWTSENKYFNCNELVAQAKNCAKELGLESIIEFAVNTKPEFHVSHADIITNSGFIRPLNETLLKHAKKSVVIPLMFEAWELRETDIDIDFCKKNNIRVAGTNENHPAIKVFESVGPLAIKLAFEAGMAVYQDNILVWSDDEFGKVSADYFRKMNAAKVLLTTNKEEALHFIKNADFVYFCSSQEKRSIISADSADSVFAIDEIRYTNPFLTIIHLYGKLKLHELESNGLNVYPKQDGKTEYMSKTLTHIGMKPTLNLLAAGLKVGEELQRNKLSELTQQIC